MTLKDTAGKKSIDEFKNGREQAILDYIDQLLPYVPDFDYFSIGDFVSKLTSEFKEQQKIITLCSDMRQVLLKRELVQFAKNSNIKIELTSDGRKAKKYRSYSKYEESLKPKTLWWKYVMIGLSLYGAIFTYLNYDLKKEQNTQKTEIEKRTKINDSLVQKNKILKSELNKSVKKDSIAE